VGLAPTVNTDAETSATPTVGKAEARGTTPTVTVQKGVSPQVGIARAKGEIPTVTQPAAGPEPITGKAHAVTAQVGPSVTRQYVIDWGNTGEAHAKGSAPSIDADTPLVTQVGKAHAKGGVPTLTGDWPRQAFPSVGKANAEGSAPSVGVGYGFIPTEGKVHATDHFTPTITRRTEIDGPFVGKAHAVDANNLPTVTVVRPGGTFVTVTGTVGYARAKGEKARGPHRRTPITGKAHAKGSAPTIVGIIHSEGCQSTGWKGPCCWILPNSYH
jgi:hypothetical protein